MIGTELCNALIAKDYRVVLLSRQKEPKHQPPGIEYAYWNPKEGEIDKRSIQQADHIIHLAGEGIADKRWTKKRKREIRDSRVHSARLIIKALSENENKVQTLISASAIGWYGEDPVVPNPQPFTEDHPPAHDFLATVCQEWEQSIKPAKDLGKRVVYIRTGIVLSSTGGVMDRFRLPLKFGMATILGPGTQYTSWIHIDDLVGIYVEAIQNKNMEGAYNAVATFPVTNKELVLQIARQERGKFFLPVHVPTFPLKLALGEVSTEVLKSVTVSPARVQLAGYEIRYPDLTSALKQLDKKNRDQ